MEPPGCDWPETVLVAASAAGGGGGSSPTVVMLVALPSSGFGSGVGEETSAVLSSTVPVGKDGSTWTTRVKTAFPGASVAAVQVTSPVSPTAGVKQVQPPGSVSDWKVTPAGNGSLSSRVEASPGPPLTTVIVKVRSLS